MITYTTKFPVNDSLTKEEFIKTVIKWNQGSPHDKINGVEWDGESHTSKWEQDKISLEFQEVDTDKIIASRLRKEDEHGIWTTDFVLNTEKHYLSVSVAMVTTEFTTDFAPTFYPPYFVKLIVYSGYSGEDSTLQVSQKAHLASDCEDLLQKVCDKEIKMLLPIVYITKGKEVRSEFSVDDLAFKIQGVAHVIHESDDYEQKLSLDTSDENGYENKAVIFYPSSWKQVDIIDCTEKTIEDIEKRIVNAVYSYMIQRVRKDVDTWDGILNEQLHLKNIELLKSKETVEEENDYLYEEFGDQLKKLEDTNARQNNEIQRLTAEVQGLRMKFSEQSQVPIIVAGEEKDLYEGEIREIVLEILEEYKKSCYEGSRRQHVIDDILQCNEYKHLPEKKREILKKALKGYRNLTGSLKNELEALGIEISSDGKHYKWSYFGDNRYVVTAAKTSSDGRSGMNLSATMEKLMF